MDWLASGDEKSKLDRLNLDVNPLDHSFSTMSTSSPLDTIYLKKSLVVAAKPLVSSLFPMFHADLRRACGSRWYITCPGPPLLAIVYNCISKMRCVSEHILIMWGHMLSRHVASVCFWTDRLMNIFCRQVSQWTISCSTFYIVDN